MTVTRDELAQKIANSNALKALVDYVAEGFAGNPRYRDGDDFTWEGAMIIIGMLEEAWGTIPSAIEAHMQSTKDQGDDTNAGA